MSRVKSPLRYPGGKSRAIRQIMRHVPATVQEYREPFIGGGSVFLAMKSLFGRRIRRYCINDLNHDLYCFWKYARDKNSELAAAAQTFKDTYADGRELWGFLKAEGNMSSDFERCRFSTFHSLIVYKYHHGIQSNNAITNKRVLFFSIAYDYGDNYFFHMNLHFVARLAVRM